MTTDTNTTDTRIELPNANDLDTGGLAPGYWLSLYLIPAAENGGIPCVVTHGGYSNGDTPMLAFFRRWEYLGTYGNDVRGESVIATLEARAESLIAISDMYLGSYWDGHNVVGRWADDDDDTYPDLASAIKRALSESLTHYWDCGDWLSHAGTTWAELCRDAEIDPERADDDAIETIAADLIHWAEGDGVRLSRVEEAVTSLRDEWISERADG